MPFQVFLKICCVHLERHQIQSGFTITPEAVLQAIFHDISSLRNAEEKYQANVHTMRDGFLLLDRNARRIMENGGETFETIHKTAAGDSISVEVSASPLPEGERLIVMVRDIPGRKEEQRHLQSLIEEKDFLMKEFNHRARNNLAMILSLIRLKKAVLRDRADLSDIERHIEAINLLNNRLYQGDSLSSVNLQSYLLEVLETVFSFASFPVRIINAVAQIPMDHKRAVPIALLTNEVAINALKHGFSAKEEASFSIELVKNTQRGEYTLRFTNNGRPFPEDVDFDDPRSLGMQIIPAFVRQLQGRISLVRSPSPVFTIDFPI